MPKKCMIARVMKRAEIILFGLTLIAATVAFCGWIYSIGVSQSSRQELVGSQEWTGEAAQSQRVEQTALRSLKRPKKARQLPTSDELAYIRVSAYEIAKMLDGECYSGDLTDKTAAAWTVVNRVDYGYADTPAEVVSAPNQYYGYDARITPSQESVDVAVGVVMTWLGYGDTARNVPNNTLWFSGDGKRNYYRTEYSGERVLPEDIVL
ncbi:MAG: cell wall hydrolase [Oscillospiraceae bacterium]|nr:cell wall hydrolase [Oscillospiraceae bacterium]